MAENKLRVAEAKAEKARSQFTQTLHELQQRLKPATLATDAWDGVKDKGSDFAGKGVQAVKNRPVAAGGIAAALAVFVLRAPIASLIGNLFERAGEDEGRVTADISHADDDFDLTAPVVAQKEGVIA